MAKQEEAIKLKDREIADIKLSCATIFIEIAKLAERNTNVADKEIAELAGNTAYELMKDIAIEQDKIIELPKTAKLR